MENNFSITRAFTSKEVLIYDKDSNISFKIYLKTVRDFYDDADWNYCFNIWKKDITELNEEVSSHFKSSLDYVKNIVFIMGRYIEYKNKADVFIKVMKSIIPTLEVNYKEHEFVIDKKYILTDNIWDYVLYVLKLSCGQKLEKPMEFTSEAARQFYLAQKEYEAQISKIKNKSQNSSDEDKLMKIILSIIYCFPSLTIDYLFNQTLAQIHWLANYAAASVSYEVNAKAFAAGNMKKGSKLNFFID